MRAITAVLLFLMSAPLIASEKRGLPQRIEVASGDVVLRTDGNRILVLVDTRPGRSAAADGRIDQWFVLETSAPPVLLAKHLPEATIVHAPGLLRVSGSGEQFDFGLAGDGRIVATADAEPVASTRIEGIGLSHNYGEGGISIGSVRSGVPFHADPGGGEACASGGVGATSCSVSADGQSRSVTCAPGYYACCNGAASCRRIDS